MKPHCDCLILGSGISGMTLSMLFASAGFQVTTLEKSVSPGGAMQRFRRRGIPLDTGFHFTGGMTDCFGDMLDLLGIRDCIEAVPTSLTVQFTESGNRYKLPAGISALEQMLCERFPDNAASLHRYFQAERDVFDNTPLFHLRSGGAFADGLPDLKWDHVTLGAFLDELHIHGELRGLLCGMCSCHGTPPGEIPFSDHARIDYGLSNDLVRLRNGGEAVVSAFLQKTEELDIDFRTNTTVRKFGEAGSDRKIHSAELSDGTEIEFEHLIFTQHPREILHLLPSAGNAFRSRVEEFSDTCGFFTAYAQIDDDAEDFQEGLFTGLTTSDLDAVLLGTDPKARTTGYLFSTERRDDGTPCRTVTAFQSVFPDETAAWNDTVTGKRPAEYLRYKARKAAEIEEQLLHFKPGLRGKMHPLASASMLTFRDWLSGFGAAYGIRRKMDQHNLFGRLPVRNFYTASQSSILPGAAGSMLTALVLFRQLAGEEIYRKFICSRLEIKEK